MSPYRLDFEHASTSAACMTVKSGSLTEVSDFRGDFSLFIRISVTAQLDPARTQRPCRDFQMCLPARASLPV